MLLGNFFLPITFLGEEKREPRTITTCRREKGTARITFYWQPVLKVANSERLQVKCLVHLSARSLHPEASLLASAEGV